MRYDFGRKFISKKTGLTGIEAKNIANKLAKQNIDYQVIDWETIGSNLYGHGHRTGGVKHHLKNMYGITLENKGEYEKEFRIKQKHNSLDELMSFFDRRTKKQKMMDLSINAKKVFKPTNQRGIKLWKKSPNQYDVEGIDDIPD